MIFKDSIPLLHTARKLCVLLPFTRGRCLSSSLQPSAKQANTRGMSSKSTTDDATETNLQRAVEAVHGAQAMIIMAGAGIGVDSGLPDFRGPQGFWKAYPPLKDKGLQLSQMSNPEWFSSDPEFAWGFFGHRYNMYKKASPHKGFTILREWGEKMEHGYFVFTSNVDGHFQKAGFDADRIVECHGSIHYLQCLHKNVSPELWPMPEDADFDVDEETLRLKSPLPKVPPGQEKHLARPNILMFGDGGWIGQRTFKQEQNFHAFQMSLMKGGGIPFVVMEIGAGLTVPTVRETSESLVGRNKGVLIRINPHEPRVPKWPKENISLRMTGLEALQRIKELL